MSSHGVVWVVVWIGGRSALLPNGLPRFARGSRILSKTGSVGKECPRVARVVP